MYSFLIKLAKINTQMNNVKQNEKQTLVVRYQIPTARENANVTRSTLSNA